MSYNMIPCDREQMFLLPPCMKDWLPPDHPVWVVIDAVASMDISPFYQNYREDGWGAAAFQPGMMVTLLLYGYRPPVRIDRRSTRPRHTLLPQDRPSLPGRYRLPGDHCQPPP